MFYSKFCVYLNNLNVVNIKKIVCFYITPLEKSNFAELYTVHVRVFSVRLKRVLRIL